MLDSRNSLEAPEKFQEYSWNSLEYYRKLSEYPGKSMEAPENLLEYSRSQERIRIDQKSISREFPLTLRTFSDAPQKYKNDIIFLLR